MKFSEKMSFKIILKVTENQSFTLSLEDIIFEKPQGGSKTARGQAVQINKKFLVV